MLPTVTRLSIVIPVKDDAAPLSRCLAALRPQLSEHDEIIVVDNGSSDSSAAVALTAGAVVLSERVPGIAAAAAAGYDRARGVFIARLDADSVPAPSWVETIVEFFDGHPGSAAVTGAASFTDGPVVLRRLGAFLYLGAYFLTVGMALGHVPLFGSNCAFRAEDWREVRSDIHRFDTLAHDDMDLSYHLGPTRRIRYLSTLRVDISARPLYGGGGVLRARRGFHTEFMHWPRDLPWLRLGRRLTATATGRKPLHPR